MWESYYNLEENVHSSILKDDFSSRIDPSIFISIAPVLLDQSNETSYVFPALNSTTHFQAQSIVSLIYQIQVQKPILVFAVDQMLDHTS